LHPMSLDASPLEAARQHLEFSMRDLWLRCLGLGGLLGPAELAACLEGRQTLGRREYDVMAQALNEGFMDEGRGHPVPYADDVDRP
jgi:hypothetical protein